VVDVKRVLVLVSAIAMTVGLAACGGSSNSGGGGSSGSGGSSGGDITVGLADDLTGPLAVYGQYTQTYVKAVVDYTNAQGGINGHKVKLVTADAAATGQNASSATQQLINSQHVSAIFGFTLSDDCGAVAALATAHKTPLICSSIPPANLSPVQKYIFGATTVEAQEVPATIQFIQDHLKLPSGTKYATIVAGSLGAQLYGQKAAAAADKAGYKQVDKEVVPLTAVNASTQISKLVSTKPQVIIAEMVTPNYLPLIKALRAAGNDAPVIASDASIGYQGMNSLADPNVYQIGLAHFITDLNPTEQGAKMAVEALAMEGQKTLDQINQVLGPQAFPAPYAVMQALKSCGYPCSGDKLADQLEQVKLTLPGLVDGTFGWTSDLHLPYSELSIYGWDPATKQPKLAQSGLQAGPLNG